MMRRGMSALAALGLLLLAGCADLGDGAGDSSVVGFAADVQPVLTANCTSCHGGDSPSGGLVLASLSGVLAGGASGAVVEPNAADSSLLVARIEAEDGSRMPPGGTLSAAQIALIRAWIDEGAQDN